MQKQKKVQKSDRLLSGETKTLNLIITYDKDKLLTSLPTSPITLSNITSTINYTMLTKEKSETPITPEKKVICKRATILHTDGIHTFGNLGTSGTLTSGDAFDCDVNGDGVYDSNAERFYYVSDYYNTSTKSFESDTAVLIYYNDVSAGNPSNNTTYAYDNSVKNINGPTTAIAQLPTTTQWGNVSLKNTKRTIISSNRENKTYAGTLPSEFSYEGYAARLLTLDEVRQATNNDNLPTWNTGELSNVNYLLENTNYSSGTNIIWAWWLETPRYDSFSDALNINSSYRRVPGDSVSYDGGNGVRPAIEVLKTNIKY